MDRIHETSQTARVVEALGAILAPSSKLQHLSPKVAVIGRHILLFHSHERQLQRNGTPS